MFLSYHIVLGFQNKYYGEDNKMKSFIIMLFFLNSSHLCLLQNDLGWSG